MSLAGGRGVWAEFAKSRAGMAGVALLSALVATSAGTAILVPSETLREWNDPLAWITYPKAAMPAWVNHVTPGSVPEHRILESPQQVSAVHGQVTQVSHRFAVQYGDAGFPDDFIYGYGVSYSGSPLLELRVHRPDGAILDLYSASIPHSDAQATHQSRVFSSDAMLRKNLQLASGMYEFDVSGLPAPDIVFSQAETNAPLKGEYAFEASFYSYGMVELPESSMVIGGKAFGLMGTDELRRDLAVGLLWGTPLALFIGLAVSVASVMAGLLYGVYAGYKGRRTDEAMMRLNDVVYALPALPFLVILSVTISNSIFVMVGFLMVFGWVGIAKVSRSMALQIKARGYVGAAESMGQRDSRIILRHVLPQLLPYAFASIAISVPAAITTEAGLSFLGLGDPSYPTWGHLLHDANTFGAAARGLWWWIVPPGVMIAVTGLAFVFIGNALDHIVNPRLRQSRAT